MLIIINDSRRLAAAAICAAGLLLAAMAAGLATADGLSPAEVVERQLLALQNNDSPTPDAGIARTFELAHSRNKRLTGPLERFTAMVKSPAYRPLIDHNRHTIAPISQTGAEASFLVTIEAADGSVLEYLWVVAPDRNGLWRTTQVSSPRPAGFSA